MGLLLGPLTAAIVNYAQGEGFWIVFPWLWRHKEFINGPLWFAQALLIFSLAYCAWRAVARCICDLLQPASRARSGTSTTTVGRTMT